MEVHINDDMNSMIIEFKCDRSYIFTIYEIYYKLFLYFLLLLYTIFNSKPGWWNW